MQDISTDRKICARMLKLYSEVTPPRFQSAIVSAQVQDGLSKNKVQRHIRRSAPASEQFDFQPAKMNHVRQYDNRAIV